MKKKLPIIGITMGDPVGIGPEIIFSALEDPALYDLCRPVVFGDFAALENAKKYTGSKLKILPVDKPDAKIFKHGIINLINLSKLDPCEIIPAKPTPQTGRVMIDYIKAAADMAVIGDIAGITTCPINKVAMQMGGSEFTGHTELLANQTKSTDFVMMLAGDRLRVALVTIHKPLKQVHKIISEEKILQTIQIVNTSLQERFGFKNPVIAVAGLNPHAGEDGIFGDEEKRIIAPAIDRAVKEGINVKGAFPPDTVFYHAINGKYHAVICMYHDQGLIPFKLIHFEDGVNTTLGLPIIRTSVDHGTAYDIAGTGKADPGSLIAAIRMAADHGRNFFSRGI